MTFTHIIHSVGWFGKLTVLLGKVNPLHKAVRGEQIPLKFEYMLCDC